MTDDIKAPVPDWTRIARFKGRRAPARSLCRRSQLMAASWLSCQLLLARNRFIKLREQLGVRAPQVVKAHAMLNDAADKAASVDYERGAAQSASRTGIVCAAIGEVLDEDKTTPAAFFDREQEVISLFHASFASETFASTADELEPNAFIKALLAARMVHALRVALDVYDPHKTPSRLRRILDAVDEIVLETHAHFPTAALAAMPDEDRETVLHLASGGFVHWSVKVVLQMNATKVREMMRDERVGAAAYEHLKTRWHEVCLGCPLWAVADPCTGIQKELVRSLVLGMYPMHVFHEVSLSVAHKDDDGLVLPTHRAASALLERVQNHLRASAAVVECERMPPRTRPESPAMRTRRILMEHLEKWYNEENNQRARIHEAFTEAGMPMPDLFTMCVRN